MAKKKEMNECGTPERQRVQKLLVECVDRIGFIPQKYLLIGLPGGSRETFGRSIALYRALGFPKQKQYRLYEYKKEYFDVMQGLVEETWPKQGIIARNKDIFYHSFDWGIPGLFEFDTPESFYDKVQRKHHKRDLIIKHLNKGTGLITAYGTARWGGIEEFEEISVKRGYHFEYYPFLGVNNRTMYLAVFARKDWCLGF